MKNEVLIKEIHGNVGILKLNRLERRNSLSSELLADLPLTLKKWAKEDSIRVVVITGNLEKAFSSGYDILAIPTDVSERSIRNFKKQQSP